VTDEEWEKTERGRCVLPCNSAVCPIFASEEMILSEGEVLRADGRRGWCMGCGVERVTPCIQTSCSKQCHICHIPYKVKDAKRIVAEAVPAVCGQKHRFVEYELNDLGGLEWDDCVRPWIPIRKLPPDRFIAGIEMGARARGWIDRAHQIPHRSWMVTIKGMFPKVPRRGLRDYFGLSSEDFLMVTFRTKDIILEGLWDDGPKRRDFFHWLAEQDIDAVATVNFSQWGDLPRMNALMMLKRMLICYAEMTDAGLPTVLEFEIPMPWFMEHYVETFRQACGIKAVHTSWQIASDEMALPLARRMSNYWRERDEDMVVLATGGNSPKTAVGLNSVFDGHRLYVGNSGSFVQAGHWIIQPGNKASKKKMDASEVYSQTLLRWHSWSGKILSPLPQQLPQWLV
jgi:hypothetical protein